MKALEGHGGAGVLVTGGAGFIGSHIVDACVAEGYRVLAIDNLSSGKEGQVSPKAEFLHADIENFQQLRDLFAAYRPDYVVHQAAQISVSRSMRDPVFDARINLIGLLHVLELSVEFGVRKLVFASSGGVLYGEVSRPAVEEDPVRPASPYGVTKLAGEFYLGCYAKQYGLPYVSLRYANVYGPRQDPDGEAGVVAIFTRAMLEGATPVIFGDGGCVRDYVYVDDVARANLLALTVQYENEAFNIGTGVAADVNRLYGLLAGLTGYDQPPRYGPPRPGDLRKSLLDCRKAEQLLGWRPQVSLEEGLSRTVDWFRLNTARNP